MSERPRRIAMAWYDRQTYGAVRDLMTDGHRLADTYEVWRMSAEQVEGEVARSGIAVVRVPIEPAPFAAWCEAQGRARDGTARTAYANAVAAGEMDIAG